MKKTVLTATTITALMMTPNAPVIAQELLTGTVRLACQAVLCLSSSERPSECSPSLSHYFSLKGKTSAKTARKRTNFLALCPKAGIASVADDDDDAGDTPVATSKISSRREARMLTCADAYTIPEYAHWMNPPNITGHAVPDGWVIRRYGEITSVAQGGWANLPIYDGGNLLGYGYALETRQVYFYSDTGTVTREDPWSTSKTGQCDIGNPEVYEAP